jgi:ribose transport system substrate-binding protein
MLVRRRMRRMAGAAVCCMAVAIAGCGEDDEPVKSAATGGNEKVKVYMLLPSLQDESYVRKLAGAQAEAEKHPDAEVVIEAGSERGEANELVSKIDSALTKGAQAIAVDAGAVPDQLVSTLQRAADDGIPIIASGIELEGLEPPAPFIGVDDVKGSQPGGEFVSEQLPDGGELGIISCFPGNPITEARTEGFRNGLAPNIEVVSVLDSKCDPEKGRSIVENMLTAHPGLDAIYSTTDIQALGALDYLASIDKDLVFVGHDAIRDAVQDIIDGNVLDATITTPFEESGAETVRALIKAARGEELPPRIDLPQELITEENATEFMAELDRIAGEG